MQLPEADRVTGAPETEAVFELVVQSGDVRDTVRRSVPIRPYGTPVFAIKGGSADSDVSAVVEAPAEMPLTAPRLQVIVGPTVQRSLMDVLFASPTWCQRYANQITASSDATVSDLLAALALQGLLGKTRDASSPQTEDIDRRVRSAISLLVSTQNDDGGWSWSGRAGASDRYYSSRVVWALSLARRSGYSIADAGYNAALDFLRNQLTASAVTDYESKCVLLHALAVAKRGDFPLANQLYRNRQSLSPAALCHLALAFAEMDRRQTASELLAMLTNRNLDEPPPRAKWLSWNQSATELHALYAVALEKTVPRDNRLREQIDWLMAHRTGYRWSPDKATGPAMLALCRWFAETRLEGEKYKLAVYVNDKLAGELDVDKDTGTQTIDVPSELLADEKQSIRFQLTGRGQFTYQCVLGGFVAADQLKSTTADWTVQRYCEPANLEVDGKTIPRGFTILQGSYNSFRNELKQLPVGRRGQIELVVRRHHVPVNTPQEQLEYLVVTEPLPAGVTVVEGSVNGGFERFEITPGAILFYIGTRPSLAPIHYEVHGYLPGQYQVAPTMVRNVYRPDQIAVHKPQAMTVLPLGAASADKYRLTPVELFELGKWHFEKHDFQAAARYLGQLSSDWNLKSDPFRETVRMLLDVHLETGPASQVVRFFEIIVEKYPDLEVPFAKLLKVGDAYDDIGEYERSYLVFRAAVEASFMRESRVAGFLQQQQEFLRSIDVMQELLREYPPESYVASASYALAQEVYAKAETASQDAKLQRRKVTRVDLIRQAWAMLDIFLTANPDDPAADEASFSLANAILDLEQYEETIRRCNQFAERFPESDFLDSFWYIIGYCHFARGEHEQALDMCRKVAAAQRIDKTTGRKTESPNKWRAVYILGQIYHSLGQAQQAIERISSSRSAICRCTTGDRVLHAQGHRVARSHASRTGRRRTSRTEVPQRRQLHYHRLSHRPDEIQLAAAKSRRHHADQSGRHSALPQTELELGDGKDYRDRTTDLELPLKDEGAYLVVCRGDNLHASGLVLISPLTLEIQEEAKSGRVRATVRDTVNENYVNAVHVKVIGIA